MDNLVKTSPSNKIMKQIDDNEKVKSLELMDLLMKVHPRVRRRIINNLAKNLQMSVSEFIGNTANWYNYICRGIMHEEHYAIEAVRTGKFLHGKFLDRFNNNGVLQGVQWDKLSEKLQFEILLDRARMLMEERLRETGVTYAEKGSVQFNPGKTNSFDIQRAKL